MLTAGSHFRSCRRLRFLRVAAGGCPGKRRRARLGRQPSRPTSVRLRIFFPYTESTASAAAGLPDARRHGGVPPSNPPRPRARHLGLKLFLQSQEATAARRLPKELGERVQILGARACPDLLPGTHGTRSTPSSSRAPPAYDEAVQPAASSSSLPAAASSFLPAAVPFFIPVNATGVYQERADEVVVVASDGSREAPGTVAVDAHDGGGRVSGVKRDGDMGQGLPVLRRRGRERALRRRPVQGCIERELCQESKPPSGVELVRPAQGGILALWDFFVLFFLGFLKPAKGRQLTSRKRPIYVSIALNDEGDGSCRDKKVRKSPIYSSLELDDEGDGSCRAKKLKKADVACNKNLKKADVVSESISPLMSVREEYVINHKSCSYPEETMEQQNVVLALGCQFPLHSLAPMTAPGHLSSSSLSLSCHLEQPSQIIKGPFLGTRSRNSDWSAIESTDQEKQSTVGSRTDLSRQKEECVSFQTPDALGSTETLQPKKGITPKSIEEDNNSMAIFEDLAQLPNDMIAGCETLPEMNKVSFIDLTPRKGIRVSQETSGIHDLQLGGYAAETSAEQDTGEDLCQRYLVMPADDYVDSLPSAKSCEATVHGDQLNRTAIVECRTGYVAPAEDLSVVCPATLDGVVTNLLQSGANLEVIESHTEELSESSQSIKKSTATRMSSVGTSNCSETGPGNSLDIVKAMAGTPIPKCVSSRTHDSCCPLSKQSVDVRQGIIDTSGGLSESLATQRLPFVKKSPIWAEIEVLEIFKKAPQRPNFHQLQQYFPDLREGMALGLMLSFDNLAESISRLEVQDDSGPLEQKMLGLSLLEANGFDVRDMRSRLETLLHERSSRVKLQDTMKKLGEDRSERN